MRAARISLEHGLSHRSRFRINRTPARKAAGQYLERQDRRRDPNKTFVGLLRASGRRGLPQELAKLPMRFDEGSEPLLPKDVRQASVAVQFMVALDQALTLQCQALWQETEIQVRSLVGKRRATCVSNLRHGFHRSASRRANRFRSMHQLSDWRHISSMCNHSH